MANLEFCDTHNMVVYLQKTEGSEGFHQIVDFLNTSHIKYALTENPTIYVSLIQQFWQTDTANTLDSGEIQITATIDGKVKLVFEASIRRHLKLEDSDGITTLPNIEIFEQLALMSSPTHTNVADEAAFTSIDVVKKLEQTVKTSQTRRRAKIIVLDDEEGSEDTSKQGRRIEDIDQDIGIYLVTPIKVSSQEDQYEDHLGVLSAAKVLTDAAKKNVNTYTRRRRAVSTGSEGVSTASRIFSTTEESVSTAGASLSVSTAGMVQQVNIIIPSSSETTKDKEQEAKFNVEQEELLASETTEDEANHPVADIDWDDVQAQIQADEDLAQKLLEEERESLSIKERARLLGDLIDKRKKLQAAQRYEAIRNKPQTMSQERKTMCTYMKNMAGYKMEHFKGKSFYEVKEMFDNVYKQVTSFVPMDSVMEKERTKKAGLNLQEESSKRQKTGEGSKPTKELKADEISQEDLQ
ncbi:hypothetical protein Tco_0503044 [Tanacetum coccineum]